MKRIIKIVFVFTLAAFPVGMFAQIKQSSNVPSSKEVLKRHVRKWVTVKEDTLRSLMTWTLITSKTPGGIVSLSQTDEETHFSLMSSGLVLRNVLDAIVAVEPRYRWEIERDVINFLPVEEYPLMLNVVIPEFRVENINRFKVIDALDVIPELQNQATALGYSNFTEPRVRCCGGLGGTETFSLHLRNATLREVLNALVRAQGYARWSYSENVYDGKRYFTIQVSG